MKYNNKDKISLLANIELYLLPTGDVLVEKSSINPIEAEKKLDKINYQDSHTIRKVVERFNEFFHIINDDLKHTIGNV